MRNYFHIPQNHKILFGNGGATLLFDAMTLTLCKNVVHHYVWGEFSAKWAQASMNIPWIKTRISERSFGHGASPRITGPEDTLAFTLNETSTGVMVSELPKRDSTRPDTLTLTDATSIMGQVPLDFTNLDGVFFSLQKALASEGGMWFAVLSPRAVERALEIESSDRYIPNFFKWSNTIKYNQKGQGVTTPSLMTLILLREQLKLLSAKGIKAVHQESQEKANFIYDWAEKHPALSPYVKDPQYRSLSTATIDVDSKFSVEEMVQVLAAKGVAEGIQGYRKLNKNSLRIALFPSIPLEDIKKLSRIIDKFLT